MRSPCCSADTHCSWLRDHAHSAEALKHSSSVVWTLQLPAEEVLNYITFIKSGCGFESEQIDLSWSHDLCSTFPCDLGPRYSCCV